MVDPAAAELFEAVQHVVPQGYRPLSEGPHAEGPRLAADPHEKTGKPGHLKVQGPDPYCPFGDRYPGQFLHRGGKEVLVKIGLGHADAADDGKALNILAPFHQFFETPVQVAHMGLALHDFVAADGKLEAHVPGNSGMLGPLPDLQVLSALQVKAALSVYDFRHAGIVVYMGAVAGSEIADPGVACFYHVSASLG